MGATRPHGRTQRAVALVDTVAGGRACPGRAKAGLLLRAEVTEPVQV